MKRAKCSERAHCRDCRPGRPLCRWRRKASGRVCWCDGINWGKGYAPHRKGSTAGKYGTCRNHPSYATLMYAALEKPTRAA